MKNMLTFLMAGGKGERLAPLTKDRAKPAVPFGGIYRIVDFTLSNCINSGVRRIYVLVQYKSMSLARHIRMGWNILNSEVGEFDAGLAITGANHNVVALGAIISGPGGVRKLAQKFLARQLHFAAE